MNDSHRSIRSLRRPFAATLALGAALALAACSTPAATTTPAAGEPAGDSSEALRIGFSPLSLQIPALKGLADGLTAVAQGQGDTVVTADANYDPSTQLEQLNGWIQLEQVDAIWVIPVSGQAIASALTAAQEKGIVVVASGLPADYGFDGPQAGITFANIDNSDYGAKLGGLAADCITTRLDGKAEIIYLQSAGGQQSDEEVNAEVKDALTAGAPEATFVNTQEAGDRLVSGQLVASALQGSPDVNTVIGTDDESSLGALDSFEAAGLDPLETCIIGAGGNDEAIQAVKDGKLFGVVAFDFEADLVQNLEQMHTMALDPTAEGPLLTVPIRVVTE